MLISPKSGAEGYEIIKTGAAHIARIAEIELECFGKAQAWSEGMLLSELSDGSKHYFSATENGIITGYAGYAHIVDEAHIMNIAVAEAYRKRGIASKLLESVLNDALGRKIVAVTLEVSDKNIPAISLYEKFNFKCAGRRRNYYPDGSDALIYWLTF